MGNHVVTLRRYVEQQHAEGQHMTKKSIRIIFFCLIAGIFLLFLKMPAIFQTKNLIEFPVIFIVLIIVALFALWFVSLKKKDDDQGFL
jgi:predicted ABC-type exoprotein transport system permease subunit